LISSGCQTASWQPGEIMPDPIKTDVVIIGTGPIGLFSVFELGLQGISCHIIDALPEPGGQCIELYPDKPIYDIPAIKSCTGEELIERLIDQISPFNPVFHMDQSVDSVEKRGEFDFVVKTSADQTFECRAVIVAAGAGSFTPVRIRLPEIDQYEGDQLLYRVRDPKQFAGKDVVILGGGDSALDWALSLVDIANSLIVVNRTERFRAVEATVDKVRALADEGKLELLLGTAQSFEDDNGRLKSLTFEMRDEEKTKRTIELDSLLVFFGLSPKLGPVENWGIELEKKAVTINIETFETSIPGIYAIGDINTYTGKKKLILSGFHEAAMAAYAIKQAFEPDKKLNVSYTTTNPTMQGRLGVES